MSNLADSGPRSLPPGGSGEGLLQSSSGGLAVPEPARVYAVPTEEATHLWDYWRIVVRHRWTVITFFTVTLIVATVWMYTTRPVFTATATLRIEREEPKVVKFEEVVRTDPSAFEDYYQTQQGVLRSRSLARRVIGLLELEQHPEFQTPADGEGGWLDRGQEWIRAELVRWIPVPPTPIPEDRDDVVPQSPITTTFLSRLSVESMKNTRLLRVSFESHYPDLAARVVNALGDAFIDYNLEQKLGATRYAITFLTKQMEEAKQRLEESEQRLTRFLSKNDILVTPDKTDERLDLTTRELLASSDALLKARAERLTKESIVAQARSQSLDSVPAVLEHAHIIKLKQELMKLDGEYQRLAQTFKSDYPRMKRIQQNLQELQRELTVEARKIVDALDAEYRVALRKEQELQKTVDQRREVARRLGGQMTEYSLLRREVDTNREQYTALLTRLKETGVSSALLTSNISIVDRAEVPSSPSKPRKGRNLLFAAVVGLIGGIGLAFFFEYLDTNIKDAKEVEMVLHVPTIGLVPSRDSLEGRRARRRRRLAEGDGTSTPFALVAHAELGSVVAETFRNLRTSILYSAPDHPPRSFMVTSLQTEDGKTSVSTNLAITLAQLGAGEILIVDGDMRRPNLHELLDVPQAPGLSTLLTGQAELLEVLKPTRIPNLYVIPAGRTPLNPAELMASRRLRQALEVLSERFAHTIFDTPPLFGVSDSMILAPRLEGVVLVLRQGRATRDAAQRAIRILTSVHARLLGVVMNDVDVRGAGARYYGYYGYYGYSYGDGSPHGSSS